MHEMNGGWYPWSSNPDLFKQAWVHVWKLSRKQGLTQTDILFDFSVNHRDMPTK
jgi:beta-mannanase